MSIGTILVILLVIILLGGLGGPYINPGWHPATARAGTATAASA